jgi:excisionase family DNA binding protein
MREFGQKDKVPLALKFSLSIEDASALTGIGLGSIRQAISDGELVARKKGTRLLILPEELKTWLGTLPKAGKKSVSEETADA